MTVGGGSDECRYCELVLVEGMRWVRKSPMLRAVSSESSEGGLRGKVLLPAFVCEVGVST